MPFQDFKKIKFENKRASTLLNCEIIIYLMHHHRTVAIFQFLMLLEQYSTVVMRNKIILVSRVQRAVSISMNPNQDL